MSKLSTDDINAAQGLRLAAVRGELGLRQAEFAERLGVSLRAYINYEGGEREMPTALFRALYDEYGIDPLWLLDGHGDTPVRHGQRVMDVQLMQQVIKLVEAWCHKHQVTLSPEKKALVFSAGYEHCVATSSLEPAFLQTILKAAA